MLKCHSYLCLLTITLSIVGCTEHNTSDPYEAYKLWSGGGKPSREIHLIHGKYWQSAHWSKEYIMFLELKASSHWKDEFIKQNNLIYKKDTAVMLEDDAPNWFKPSSTCRIFVPKGFNEGSVYYCDSTSDRMFIYEIQL